MSRSNDKKLKELTKQIKKKVSESHDFASDIDKENIQLVKKYGWVLNHVHDHKPDFCYTTGLMSKHEHPDLLIFDADQDAAYEIFATMFKHIKAGKRYRQGVHRFIFDGDPIRLGIRNIHESQIPKYMGFSMSFMRNIGRIGELKAVQVFWSDGAGLLPFEKGCDPKVVRTQPRLDMEMSKAELNRWRAYEISLDTP